MGRPQKYASEEERREARRLQTRAHVKAHRLRLKQKEVQTGSEANIVKEESRSPGMTSADEKVKPEEGIKSEEREDENAKESSIGASDDLEITENGQTEQHALTPCNPTPASTTTTVSTTTSSPFTLPPASSSASSSTTPLLLSPRFTDIHYHSRLPTIDLTFGAGAHIIDFFIKFENHWPWRQALAYESNVGDITDRMVEKSLISVGMNLIANMYNSAPLRLMALDSQSYALKEMRKWLKMAPYPLLAPLVASAHTCLLGTEITESYRSGHGCGSILIQIEGGLEILRSAGPHSFLSSFGLLVFRALQRRVVIMGVRKRLPVIDEYKWYSVLFRDNVMSSEDKLFAIITRIPRIMQYTDVVKAQIHRRQQYMDDDSNNDDEVNRQQMCQLLAESYTIQNTLSSWMLHEAPTQYQNGDIVRRESSNLLDLPSDTAGLIKYNYTFETTDDLFIMVTYWQYLVHLLLLIHEQQELIWQCQNNTTHSSPPAYQMPTELTTDLHTNLSHLCHSIEPVLDPALAPAAWETVMCSSSAPLRLIVCILGQHSHLLQLMQKEYAWCIAVARTQRTTQNIQELLREFLADGLFGGFDELGEKAIAMVDGREER